MYKSINNLFKLVKYNMYFKHEYKTISEEHDFSKTTRKSIV